MCNIVGVVKHHRDHTIMIDGSLPRHRSVNYPWNSYSLEDFRYHHSVISMVFNVNNTAHLVSTKFCMIQNVMWILLSVLNKTNNFNSGVLAYKLNSLMMVVATPKPVGIWTDCVRTLG
jgi:hypothetical protein